MTTERINLAQITSRARGHLRTRSYLEAAQELAGEARKLAMAQTPLILQRYMTDMAMECMELAGCYDDVIEYCDLILAQYDDAPPQTLEALKDRDIALLRKGCLLIKAGNAGGARDVFAALVNSRPDLEPITRRLLRYTPASINQLETEQRNLGLFNLSGALLARQDCNGRNRREAL